MKAKIFPVLLTGTTVYGPRTERSDIDVCILNEDWQWIGELLDTLPGIHVRFADDESYLDADMCVYLEGLVPGKIVNLIIVSNALEMLAWEFATANMVTIQDRGTRLNAFHSLLHDYRKRI